MIKRISLKMLRQYERTGILVTIKLWDYIFTVCIDQITKIQTKDLQSKSYNLFSVCFYTVIPLVKMPRGSTKESTNFNSILKQFNFNYLQKNFHRIESKLNKSFLTILQKLKINNESHNLNFVLSQLNILHRSSNVGSNRFKNICLYLQRIFYRQHKCTSNLMIKFSFVIPTYFETISKIFGFGFRLINQ